MFQSHSGAFRSFQQLQQQWRLGGRWHRKWLRRHRRRLRSKTHRAETLFLYNAIDFFFQSHSAAFRSFQQLRWRLGGRVASKVAPLPSSQIATLVVFSYNCFSLISTQELSVVVVAPRWSRHRKWRRSHRRRLRRSKTHRAEWRIQLAPRRRTEKRRAVTSSLLVKLKS